MDKPRFKVIGEVAAEFMQLTKDEGLTLTEVLAVLSMLTHLINKELLERMQEDAK
jgi:hypothetical protein